MATYYRWRKSTIERSIGYKTIPSGTTVSYISTGGSISGASANGITITQSGELQLNPLPNDSIYDTSWEFTFEYHNNGWSEQYQSYVQINNKFYYSPNHIQFYQEKGFNYVKIRPASGSLVQEVYVVSKAGTFQEYVYSTSASAYPNGDVSGSYYYDQRTTVTSPTNPGSITIPESIKGGEAFTISWAAASGVAATVSGYQLQRKSDNGSWVTVYTGSSLSYKDTVAKGTNTVAYQVRAYDVNNQYSSFTTSRTVTVINNEPPSAPASISVTPPVAGETTTITITAATDPDGTIASYQYERSVDSNDWTLLINADQLTYTDTVDAEWGTVAYRVRAVDNEGAAGPYATSETFTVNTGWLIISGPDEGMGSQPAPFAFSVSANITGSTGQTSIAIVITLDGAQIYSDTVNAGQVVTQSIDTRLMGEGEHTIAVSVSKENYLPTSRAYVFTVPGITLPDGGCMVQFENQAGSPVFPVTLARGVIGKNGRSIEDIVEELEVSGTFGANIVTGTYQGSGTFGGTSPNLLALAFAPKMLFLFDTMGAMTVIVPFIGKYSPKLGTSGAGTVTTEGTSVSWYAANAADQMNSSGVTYTYVAIG